VKKPRLLREIGWLVLCLAILMISQLVAAQDYNSVVREIFRTGQATDQLTSLSFIDGGLHQYAVAEGSGPDYLVSLTFIEERWSRSGGDDIIDQWIVTLEPDNGAVHRRLVERDSEVVSVDYLETEGAGAVVQRIMDKIAHNPS
jgi:hypothetical protein